MKKITFCFFILSFQFIVAQAQLTETQKLAATCKVWGFLKYYHPTVAGGKINIDEQLFALLPKIEKANTKEQFSIIIENWITSLGQVPARLEEKSKVKVDYFDKNFDLSWINDNKFFSNKLSKDLRFIEKNRYQGKQFYVCSNCGTDNAIPIAIQNEIDYPNFKWDNRNLRLLSLFRYWNLVEYFFPYKYQMDINWDTTLSEMIPRFTDCESETNYFVTLKELTVRINDSHASFNNMKFNTFLGTKFMPVQFKIIEEKAIITRFYKEDLAKDNDLRIGDVITKVGGKKIIEIINEKKKYVRGSNDGGIIDNFDFVLLNGAEDLIDIEFIRNDSIAAKKIKRYGPEKLNIQYDTYDGNESDMLVENIGYVNLGILQAKNIPKIMSNFKDTQAIVFDARWYPQDVLLSLADYLNPQEKSYAKLLINNMSYPGRFVWEKTRVCGKKNPDYYKGKVVVLVNEQTYSRGEFTVMVLQTAPNVTIVGSQTAGTDGPNCDFQIMKEFKTSFSGSGVFYPDARETQRIGIVPDIIAKTTIKGMLQNTDDILNRAMWYIIKNKS